MANGELLQAAIILFILGGIGFISWRNGQHNPVNTGKLQHDMKNVRQEVGALGSGLQAIRETVDAEKRRVDALAERFASIETKVGGIAETGTATARRVRDIDKRQDKMAEDLAATRAEVAAQGKQLDMIYKVIVPKGMER